MADNSRFGSSEELEELVSNICRVSPKRPMTDEERKRPTKKRRCAKTLPEKIRTDFTARPTEYRGIQYRSKCEAMFAMWLHLKHSNEVLIEYEPAWATDGDYVVDFAVHRPEYSRTDVSGCPIVETHVELIEYKPATPTVSYCAEKSMAMRRIANRISDVPTVALITMNIYYGSVYTNDRGAFLCGGADFHSCKLNWLGKHERKIREHRFDLESEED